MFNKKVLAMATAALNSAKPPAKKKDIIVDPRGQWEHPGEVTRIPGNDITMQGVPYPVYGVDNTGYGQLMYPGQDYTFPGDYVDEYPMMQKGGSRQPIYVSNPRDPRIQAYQDSLNLSNYSTLQANKYFGQPNPDKYNSYDQREAIARMRFDRSIYNSLANSVSDIYGNKLSNLQKRTGYLPIGQRYLGEGSNYIFKKPVQPVYYKELETPPVSLAFVPPTITDLEFEPPIEPETQWTNPNPEMDVEQREPEPKTYIPEFARRYKLDPKSFSNLWGLKPRYGHWVDVPVEADGGYISTPDLPQAQRGARVKPLYVTDPNDIRLAAYNDSLWMYKNNLEPLKSISEQFVGADGVVWNIKPYKTERKSTRHASVYTPHVDKTYSPEEGFAQYWSSPGIRNTQNKSPYFRPGVPANAPIRWDKLIDHWKPHVIEIPFANRAEQYYFPWENQRHDILRSVERARFKKPVRPVYYRKPDGTVVKSVKPSSTTATYTSEYEKKHPPIYLSDPNDPRIGSYAEAGNQYLYKPVAPKTNPQLEILKLPTKPLSTIPSPVRELQIIPFVAPENNNIKILEQKDVPRTMRVPVQSTETYYVQLYPGGPKVPRQRPVTTYQEVPYTDERAGKVSEYDIKTGTFKKKKGGSTKSSKYSRSLEATNKLFHESHLMKKSKSKKKKIYDPYAKYLQEGGMIDQFHSMPSQRPAFFMGPDGEYVLDPMYEAFSKQKADVAESNRKAQEFNQAYAQSKNYERLLRRQGYTPEEIQKRIGSVMNINDFRYTDTGPSWVGGEDVGKEFISYNVTDPGDWPGFDQIAAHEWGHVGIDTGNLPLKPQEREQFINRIKESEAGVTGNPEDLAHDMEPQENRADLTQLRQQLQETGVFDSRKKKRFTAKDLENYKKMMQSSEKNWNNMWNRMFRLYDDKDIIWFMNNVAQNDIDSQGDDLVKAQVGYAAAPMPRPITDLPEITVKGKKQKSGRIKDSRPEYAKGYYDPYGVPDNTLENIVEIFDPTGMTSWDDIIRAEREFGKDSWQANLERLGAVPLVGKAAKTLKALKYLPMTARQRRSFNTSLNTLRGMGITGRGTDAYQAYDEGLKQKGGFQDDINKRRRLLTDWTYGKDLGLTQAQNGLIISDPNEYKYRKAMYDDSLTLYTLQHDLRKKHNSAMIHGYNKYLNAYRNIRTPSSFFTLSPTAKAAYIKKEKEKQANLDKLYNEAEKKRQDAVSKFLSYNKKNPLNKADDYSITEHWLTGTAPGEKPIFIKNSPSPLPYYEKPVQPVFFKEEPSIPVLKTLPLKTLDINLGTQEIIPQTWEYKMDSNPGIVLPESREEWKTLPGTGTKYRVQRPVDPRFSRKYNLRTGSYSKGGEYNIGDEVDEATMLKLKQLGYKFE